MSTDGHPLGWRDALTPHDRPSRQRWTASWALLLLALGAGALDSGVNEAVADDGRGALALVLLVLVFGMFRRGTRRLTATDHPELDERDRRARERASRLALPAFVLVATVAALPWACSRCWGSRS